MYHTMYSVNERSSVNGCRRAIVVCQMLEVAALWTYLEARALLGQSTADIIFAAPKNTPSVCAGYHAHAPRSY